jgi:predicted Zn-dependent protease
MTAPAGPLTVADQILELVRRKAGPAAEAEVVVEHTTQSLTRFANSFIHQNVADEITSVRLRLHLDGRTAAGSTTLTGGDGLRDLVDRTVEASRLCPVDAQWPGLAPPTPVAASAAVDEATAHATPAQRAARVGAFVDACGGLESAGYCRTLSLSVAFANSAGQAVQAHTTEASMDGIARFGLIDGVGRRSATRLDAIDGAVLGARAAAKARAGADPVELPPGRYEVVLEPTAVLDVVLTMASFGFNGKSVNERRSFVELGAAQLDPAVTIVDDPGQGGLPFDVEGTPRHRREFVAAGVCQAVAHDRRSAAQAGVASTGHALPGGASWGAIATDLTMVPSGDLDAEPREVDGPAADAAVAELASQVGRGLLVTDNWYTRVLDPRTLAVTGLTRNGVWLIEDGVITKPVQNMRFTQSYPQALAPGAVLGVGAVAVWLPSDWGTGGCRVPALRLASWNYTGNASG